MAKRLYNEENIQAIANAIREKNGSTDTYKVSEMAEAIDNIITDGNRLPNIYQEVEYIESTGTQYIDTGIVADIQTELSMNININEVFIGWICGSRQASAKQQYGILMIGSSTLRYDYGESSWNVDAPSKIGFHNLTLSKISKWDNLTNEFSYTGDLYNGNVYLFNLNNNGTPDANGGKYCLYKCTIKRNNEIIRDFIPCYRKADGEIGLYDIKNKIFYTNKGTGTFLKGENINYGDVILDVTNNDNITIEGNTLVIERS